MRITLEEKIKMCEEHIIEGKSLSHISEMYPTKGYKLIRKDIRDEKGYIPSLYLTYKCFREMRIFLQTRYGSDESPELI